MQTEVRVLRVFLASPSDVAPERRAAVEVIDEMNKLLLADGWQIALYRWEDATPGYGRPQEIINSEVDSCSLFIGLLWERWGQETGKYSSGFEEEYERALSRRESTGEPEIWLVFKTVDPSKLRDPGEQLRRVLEFRSAQAILRKVLFKEVIGLDEWKTKLQSWLWSHVLKQSRPAAPAPEKPQQPAQVSESELHGASGLDPGVSRQLRATATALADVVNSGELEFSKDEARNLQEFDIARLYLLAATWMSRRYTADTLGTHEANLLYKHRLKLRPTVAEYHEVIRSLIADRSNVIPGWYWLRGMSSDTARIELLMLAEGDASSTVRAAALRMMRTAKIELPETMRVGLRLMDDDNAARTESYKYLASVADEDALQLVQQSIAAWGDDVPPEATRARTSILLRLRPKEAFSELLRSGEYVSDETLEQIASAAGGLDLDVLKEAAESQWEQVRRFAVKELSARRVLDADLAEKLTADPSIAIRQLAYLELATQGRALDFAKIKQSLSPPADTHNRLAALSGLGGLSPHELGDPTAVVLTLYRYKSAEEVWAAVSWYDVDSATAYRSLAVDHYKEIERELRPDLENGFERIRQQGIQKLEKDLGADRAKRLIAELQKYDNFIRAQFVAAALDGLAANGEPADIRFGRQYLSSDSQDVRLAAVRIVARFGSAQDAAALMQASKDGWGEIRDEAGAAALHLSDNPLVIAVELATGPGSALVQAGYSWLYAHTSAEVDQFFEQMLGSGSESHRTRAVYYFSKRLDRGHLADLLDEYLKRETHYYNVVAWLDKLLYAPQPLAGFFTRELARQSEA